jgi:hypothetical protein
MGDDEITNLQTSIQWFKTTAVKLNEILDQQKYDIQMGKYHRNMQSKDLKFINDHVKEARRQNKLTGLAIERTNYQNKKMTEFF